MKLAELIEKAEQSSKLRAQLETSFNAFPSNAARNWLDDAKRKENNAWQLVSNKRKEIQDKIEERRLMVEIQGY